MPITHEWNGTVLTITSDSGTSSADLKGQKGDDGARGAQGAAGITIVPDLTIYAEKTYVDAALEAIPTYDLSTYATTEYVDNAIAEIDVAENIDLTEYAKTAYVDTEVAEVAANLNDNYYTKAETTNAITASLPNLNEYIKYEDVPDLGQYQTKQMMVNYVMPLIEERAHINHIHSGLYLEYNKIYYGENEPPYAFNGRIWLKPAE